MMDVLVLAPLMMYAGHRLVKKGDAELGTFIAAAGVGTAIYNWGNYERKRRQLENRRRLERG